MVFHAELSAQCSCLPHHLLHSVAGRAQDLHTQGWGRVPGAAEPSQDQAGRGAPKTRAPLKFSVPHLPHHLLALLPSLPPKRDQWHSQGLCELGFMQNTCKTGYLHVHGCTCPHRDGAAQHFVQPLLSCPPWVPPQVF